MRERRPCACCSPWLGDLVEQAPRGDGPAATTSTVELSRRTFIKASAGLAAAVALRAELARADARTTVFQGAVVLPADDAFSEAEALAIRGNKVFAVGSKADVLTATGAGAEVVDLGGGAILPGFIEPHMHFALMAGVGHWADVGAFRFPTVAGALQRLREVARGVSKDDWVSGRQFDPSLQEGIDELTTKELDTVSSTQPVFVLNASGHLAYVNSKALELAGITQDTPDPDGAVIARYPDGRPSGVMKGPAAFLPILLKNEALLRRIQTGFVEAGIGVADQASRLGITTLCDQATGGLAGKADLDYYRQMYASGRMKTRMRASLYSIREEEWDATDIKPDAGNAMLRVVGWKIVSDGSNQGFTGLQREPYLRSADRGIAYVGADDLKRMVLERGRLGWQLVIHANGDKAIDNVLDAVDAAAASGIDVTRLRIRIEHCSILHDDQISRIAKHGVSPSFLVNHIHFWGKTFRDEVFGEAKAKLLDRCGSVERAGVTWTSHSDAPVSDLGPLRLIEDVVVRNLWKEPDYILGPDERVPVESAIRSVTSYAAWQCHSENEIGSLEPGKFADFVVLEKDPRTVRPTDIHAIGVRETWLDGVRTYKA